MRVVQPVPAQDHLHAVRGLLTLLDILSDEVGVQPEEEGTVVVALGSQIKFSMDKEDKNELVKSISQFQEFYV